MVHFLQIHLRSTGFSQSLLVLVLQFRNVKGIKDSRWFSVHVKTWPVVQSRPVFTLWRLRDSGGPPRPWTLEEAGNKMDGRTSLFHRSSFLKNRTSLELWLCLTAHQEKKVFDCSCAVRNPGWAAEDQQEPGSFASKMPCSKTETPPPRNESTCWSVAAVL